MKQEVEGGGGTAEDMKIIALLDCSHTVCTCKIVFISRRSCVGIWNTFSVAGYLIPSPLSVRILGREPEVQPPATLQLRVPSVVLPLLLGHRVPKAVALLVAVYVVCKGRGLLGHFGIDAPFAKACTSKGLRNRSHDLQAFVRRKTTSAARLMATSCVLPR